MAKDKSSWQFTGWHMTAIMVAFFGTIMAVNFTMAGLAVSGFSGTVVDNSYVASQKFNSWLAAADAQEKLGWRLKTERLADGHVTISISEKNASDSPFAVSGHAEHPLDAKTSVTLDFEAGEDGILRSAQPLPEGRWHLYLTINSNGRTAYLESNLP